MGFYRRKNKQGKHYGPWYIQYPKETDPLTGKVKYACEKVGFSKRMASRAFAREMLKWQERKYLGLEKKETHTFGEVVDWYLSLPSTRQVKSIYKIRQHCRRLKEAFGSMRAEEIKPSMVESYQQKRLSEITYRGTPYRPASVNREVEVMRRIYSLAMREDIVLKNPCWKVTRLSEKNAKDRALTREEFNRLLRELPRHTADIVTVAYYTGMRAGEIYGMTWERVNMKQGYFNLTQKDTKTGEARHVYFSGAVREILERLEKIRYISHNFVFTYRGKPLKRIKVCFARALKKAKIKDFKFHDLRHTFTTNARKAGVGDSVVMKLTGHKTMSMFIRYNTVDSADARQALKLMEDYSGEEERGTTANSTVGAKKGSGAIS